MNLTTVRIDKPEDLNFILGQAHFIKTVEDLHETLVSSVPGASFGLAFNEASGPCLTRWSGNDEALVDLAVRNLQAIGAGHTFIVFLKDAFPINVLNGGKMVPEVCRVFWATSNPVDVVVAETGQVRGVLGVIDGSSPLGVETDEDVTERKDLLRRVGYKL